MAKEIKIPKSVLGLRMSQKKFAKKNNIKLKGKGMTKQEKNHNEKRLQKEYAEYAINGLNKAVKILAENPTDKKIEKVKTGVENVITNPETMKKIAKIYHKDQDQFKNMKFLPDMIMNSLVYYSSEGISEEEKAIGASLDKEGLIEFCETILKKEIKKYKKSGLPPEVAYQLATVIPTNKLFKNNRQWYKRLIVQLYDIAEQQQVDIDLVMKAIIKLDKNGVSKKDFLEGFFSEFILQKNTNKNAKFNDTQKELHDNLVERTLVYLDGLKANKLRDILKKYIKRRKTAEEYKNDTKRVIKFTDHANSNSPYENIKKVVTELIEENSSNELYLS